MNHKREKFSTYLPEYSGDINSRALTAGFLLLKGPFAGLHILAQILPLIVL